MTPPRLLALDLATNVGHAHLVRGSVPRFGTLRLAGDVATKLGQFGNWLDDQYMVDRFDALAWERPLITPKDTVDLLELLYGLVGICYRFVGHRSHPMPHREIDVPTVKATLTGNSRAKKPEVIAAAMKTMNWKVATDHEADAGGVGICAYEQLWPKVAA